MFVISRKIRFELQGNKQESAFNSLMVAHLTSQSITAAKCQLSYRTIIENNPLKTYLNVDDNTCSVIRASAHNCTVLQPSQANMFYFSKS